MNGRSKIHECVSPGPRGRPKAGQAAQLGGGKYGPGRVMAHACSLAWNAASPSSPFIEHKP